MKKDKAPKAEIRQVEFHPAQYDFYNSPARFKAAISGLQSGKTFCLCYWLRKKMYEFPTGTGLVVAPSYKLLAQAFVPKFFSLFPQFRSWYKENRGVMELPSGGLVYFRSMDDPNSCEGISANYIACDEGGQMSDLAWQVMRGRVSATGGQIAIATTPYNMSNWLYLNFFLPWKDGKDKDLAVYTWRSIDSPYFSTEYAESERSRMRPEEFARRYEGRFEKMTGLVFDFLPEQIIDPIDLIAKAQSRIIGVDWGYVDAAAIVVAYLVNDIWYIVSEWKESKRTTAEIIQVIKNKMSEHRATMIYCDTAEPDRIEELRRAGLPSYETDKDVKGGISFIQQLIREHRILVFNTNKEFIQEASMYHYAEPKDDKNTSDLPVKSNDHLMDAMRYAIYSHHPAVFQQMKASAPAVLPYYPDLGI